MNAIQPFLKYHLSSEIIWLEKDKKFETTIANRKLVFILSGEECTITNEEGQVINLTYKEMMRISHYSFVPYVRLMTCEVSLERIQFFKASDLGIRLSLCFAGDLVSNERAILISNAGVQSEATIKRVI
jgi:hypothetical protein